MYLLDTNTLKLAIEGDESVVQRAQRNLDNIQALEDLRIFPLFLYSPEAEAIYRTFAPATLRIGAQDCRIAAQAMAHEMIVVTRNLRDFQAIGAPCEDWSAA